MQRRKNTHKISNHKQGGGQPSNKPHEGKIKEIEEYIFKCGTARHFTQFTKPLKKIAVCRLTMTIKWPRQYEE